MTATLPANCPAVQRIKSCERSRMACGITRNSHPSEASNVTTSPDWTSLAEALKAQSKTARNNTKNSFVSCRNYTRLGLKNQKRGGDFRNYCFVSIIHSFRDFRRSPTRPRAPTAKKYERGLKQGSPIEPENHSTSNRINCDKTIIPEILVGREGHCEACFTR